MKRNIIEISKGKSAQDVLKENELLKNQALAVKTGNELFDLSKIADTNLTAEIITKESPEALHLLRHSASHIMAQAVQDIFPEVKIGIGPSTEDGFYYDFLKEEAFTPDDLEKISARIQEIIKADSPFHKEIVSREKAVEIFSDMAEDLKVELIKERGGEEVSLYKHDTFIDFCRGPHLPSTGKVPVVKLLSVAGAYWKGDENNRMLQRIYGTAFFNKKDLNKYLNFLEEAKKRDHRKLGPNLDIYHTYEEAGAGLIFWHPNGAILRTLIEDFWKKEHLKRGYHPIITPHIAKDDLWKTSGHLDYYRENMYTLSVEKREHVLKPMNCPFHILVFTSKRHSFRELPLRFSELGTVYRNERAGVLHGMLRVRGFTQDDAHIFCTPEQVEDEVLGVLDLAKYIFTVFGFKDYKVELSVRDPENKEKYAGADEQWKLAESGLVSALQRFGWEYTRQEGEAVFYGPKIDIKLIDAIGNKWQATTVQFDFTLPERFNITYVGSDGNDHRVIMIHRAIFGSLERFIGTLIEHYSGAFPVWLAPTQAVVIPISEKFADYAGEVSDQIRNAGLRVNLDDRNEKMNYRLREAQLQKVPFMVIVGEREEASKSISVRHRSLGDLGSANLNDFILLLRWLDENKVLSFKEEFENEKGPISEWVSKNNLKKTS